MKQRLQLQKTESIKHSQKDSPLYMAIRSGIMAYLTEMRHIQSCPEAVLIDVLRVLDDIKENPDGAETICEERWDDLVLEYQQLTDYAEGTEAEITHMVGLILYLTALLLMWDDGESAIFYHARAELLCNKVAAEMQDFRSYFQPMREKLLNHAEALTDWITDYMESDSFLSDELMTTSNTRRNNDKPSHKKQTSQSQPEKQHGVDYPVFAKGPGVTEDHIKAVYNYLTARGWISTQTKETTFQLLFSGGSNSCEIIWTEQDKRGGNEPSPLGVSALYSMFKQMKEESHITTLNDNPVGPILETHFVNSNGIFLTSVSNSTKTSAVAKEVIAHILAYLRARPNADDVQQYLNENMESRVERHHR